MRRYRSLDGRILRLQVMQPLDGDGVKRLRDRIEEIAAGSHSAVELELSSVPAIDGSGIGMIAFLAKRLAARGGRLVISGLTGEPARILGSLGIARQLGGPELSSGWRPANDSAAFVLEAEAA